MKKSQLFLFIALGIVFWFTAAMVIRLAGANVFSENNPMLILFFVLVFPLTYIFLLVTKLVTKVPYTKMLLPVVIMTLTAALLDGIALAFFRNLYAQSFEVALHGAAWILWGVGIGLLFAFILNNRNNESKEALLNI
jgi:Family of unknown function (DUF5367)